MDLAMMGAVSLAIVLVSGWSSLHQPGSGGPVLCASLTGTVTIARSTLADMRVSSFVSYHCIRMVKSARLERAPGDASGGDWPTYRSLPHCDWHADSTNDVRRLWLFCLVRQTVVCSDDNYPALDSGSVSLVYYDWS